MKIAVVDDFQKDRDKLAFWIEGFVKDKGIGDEVFSYPGGEEFLGNFSSGSFQIVFLDIYMNGMNGMETARQIRMRDADCLIVFSTSSDRFAVQGYKVRAFDYLVKPYGKDKVLEVMHHLYEQLLPDKRYIEVKEERVQKRLLLQSIRMAELIGHYMWIEAGGQVVKTRMKTRELQDRLQDSRFMECYRNIIVNLDYVEKLDNGGFLLKDGKFVPIQTNRLKQVKQEFADYMFEKTRKGRGPV